MYFCIYLLYVFFSNLVLCLSCSSRTAIDVFECRARSYYCLSLNKRFVVVVVFITFYTFSDMPLSCPFNLIQDYNNIVFTMKEIPASCFSSFIIITIIIIIISSDGNMDKAINVKFWSKF